MSRTCAWCSGHPSGECHKRDKDLIFLCELCVSVVQLHFFGSIEEAGWTNGPPRSGRNSGFWGAVVAFPTGAPEGMHNAVGRSRRPSVRKLIPAGTTGRLDAGSREAVAAVPPPARDRATGDQSATGPPARRKPAIRSGLARVPSRYTADRNLCSSLSSGNFHSAYLARTAGT